MKKLLFTIMGGVIAYSSTYAQTLDRSIWPKAGPAPTVHFAQPKIVNLPNGITLLIVEDHTVPEVRMSFSIDRGVIKEGDKAGVLSLMGEMLNEGTQKHSKAEFDEAVEQMGSSVNLSSGGGNFLALKKYTEATFQYFVEALKEPAFAQSSFDKVQKQALTALKSNEKSAAAVSSKAVNALNYGKNTALGEFETPETVGNITLADVKDYYKQYITPSRSYVVISGDISNAEAEKMVKKYMGDWTGTKLTLPVITPVSNPVKTEVDLVNLPNVVQSKIVVSNLVNMKLSNPDYFSATIANQILGGGSESRLFKDLREKKAYTYGSYSSIGTSREQSLFKATAEVRNEKTDSAVYAIQRNIEALRKTLPTNEELDGAKAIYSGSFAIGMENPTLGANLAMNILKYDLPKDFYNKFLTNIDAVTPQQVQGAAQKYFNYDQSRIIVTGKAEEYMPGLKKMGYTVKTFDTNIDPVDLSAANAVNTNVNASAVVAEYINKIGGESAAKGLNSFIANGEVSIQGMTLQFEQKAMAPNKEYMSMSMGGNAVMKQVFNGTTGYAMQMGQKKEMSKDEVAKSASNKYLIPQLSYTSAGYTLKALADETLDGDNCHKIEVTLPSGDKTVEYYSIKTGLLLKDVTTTKQGDMSVETSKIYTNYQKVGDVLLPFGLKLVITVPQGSQEIPITIKDYKVNSGVSASDFD